MPYLCEPNGDVYRVSPSVARRKAKKGWIRPVPELPEIYIRCGGAVEERGALRAAQQFWVAQQHRISCLREAHARYNAWLDQRDARKEQADRQAEQAWRRHLRRQTVALLKERNLPLNTPIDALSLPRRTKRHPLVAHGRGQQIVGAFHAPSERAGP